jgi:hypothetical protein
MLNFKNKTMKELLLLTKTLLAAVLLCVGQNAWGGTSEVFSQASWSHTHPGAGQNGDRSSSLSFTGTSSIDDNWTASFDVTTTSTNSRTNGTRNFQVALLSASAASFPSNALATTNVLFGANFVTTTNTDYSSFPCTITVNDVAEAGTVTLNHGTKYTFTVSVNGTSMTVSIKNGETSVFSKAVTLGSFVKPKGIYDLLPRPYNAGWGVYTNTYSDILVTKEVTAEEVTNPSIAVAYASANRTVTITPGVSSESNEVTTYYTLNGDDPTSSDNVYSAPFDVDEACTVKAISISSTSVASGIASQAVTVGKLKLVAPTLTKTGYAAGKYTVSMASNQSSLAYPPASYTNYYSIDGGDAVAYSAPFEVSEGSTVTGYVVATNYTNSDETISSTAVRPTLSEVWSIDFSGQATEDKGSVTVGDAAFTANGVSFGNISGSFTSNDNFGVKTGTSWLLRNTGSTGLYSFNGSGTPVGVQNLTAGQYIKMIVADMSSFSVSGAASLVDGMSTTTEKYIVVNEDGNANINFNRYGYIKSISVCNVAVPVTVSAAGYATYVNSDYDLDFSETSIEAYKVKVNTKGVATMTKVDNVPANTPVLLYKEGGAEENIPVMTGAAAVSDNDLVAGTGAAVATTDGEFTNMILNNVGGNVGFYFAAGNTVAANRAYLHIATDLAPATSARMAMFFTGGITGVDNVEAAAEAKAKEGKFIENGKLVIVKNGVKYNAAGAKLY